MSIVLQYTTIENKTIVGIIDSSFVHNLTQAVVFVKIHPPYVAPF